LFYFSNFPRKYKSAAAASQIGCAFSLSASGKNANIIAMVNKTAVDMAATDLYRLPQYNSSKLPPSVPLTGMIFAVDRIKLALKNVGKIAFKAIPVNIPTIGPAINITVSAVLETDRRYFGFMYTPDAESRISTLTFESISIIARCPSSCAITAAKNDAASPPKYIISAETAKNPKPAFTDISDIFKILNAQRVGAALIGYHFEMKMWTRHHSGAA